VSTIAGSLEREAVLVDGQGADARFNYPCGVAVDAEGSVIVADRTNSCIRRIAPDGTVSTIAGSLEGEAVLVDGPAADARFTCPQDVLIDAEGNVIVLDVDRLSYSVSSIRKLTGCGLAAGSAIPKWHVGPSRMSSEFSAFMSDEQFADITFVAKSTRIKAHRTILAARSEYFMRMFTSRCSEAVPGATIVIGETTLVAFRKLLAYMYSDELSLDGACVIDVMKKAHEWTLTRAYNICMQYCLKHADESNSVAWLVCAKESGLEELKEVMLSRLKRNFRAIRSKAPDSLARLAQHPDLSLEVMLGSA